MWEVDFEIFRLDEDEEIFGMRKRCLSMVEAAATICLATEKIQEYPTHCFGLTVNQTVSRYSPGLYEKTRRVGCVPIVDRRLKLKQV